MVVVGDVTTIVEVTYDVTSSIGVVVARAVIVSVMVIAIAVTVAVCTLYLV